MDEMQRLFTKSQFRSLLELKLKNEFATDQREASNEIFYKALCLVLKDALLEKRRHFAAQTDSRGKKRVYYLCMEFLIGRSLKNNLYNLGMEEIAQEVLQEMNVSLDDLYELEPDAGLGNGGLGRLAACFLDSLASQDYCATGYSILYEYGIFKQKIIDGWQTETPDNWLPGGDVWLVPRRDQAVDVHFDGEIQEYWHEGFHEVHHVNYSTVKAVPFDLYLSGFDSEGVSKLRLWKATSPGLDMELFNKGDYLRAMGQNSMAEVISKVLYPNDNHVEGKMLRLRQQYFMCAASIADICRWQLKTYGTMENLPEKVAIHINDTHPTLAVPELMRILLDECGYSWEKAWSLVTRTFAYTNHTVMSEALEVWNEDLFKACLPRIYQIVHEINERACAVLFEKTGDLQQVARMAVVADHRVRMANLSVIASHSVNGVSKIHSDILKKSVFHDFYTVMPQKFCNVTNGIASRRWLYQSNPALTGLLNDLIGTGYIKDTAQLEKFRRYEHSESVLKQLAKVKHANKEAFAAYIQKNTGVALNPDSVFDVQVKRLHEYKRQHLNALHIITQYQQLLENPNMDFVPKTYIFGAKAAPGYYLAKQIIRLICSLSKELEQNPLLRDKLRILYLEDYRVTLSEQLMPASEISEQISLAGTEASGTGNMKLMLNGAVTIGTLDGANIEIKEACGDENIITFGMTAEEVDAQKAAGYRPKEIYDNNETIKKAIDLLTRGIAGNTFEDVANSLKNSDPYMVLRDFEAYRRAQEYASQCYRDTMKWQRMSVNNIAGAGQFSADRSIQEYAKNIWGLK
ncbi:starch phosphorylase [Acetanaerobacterium elongatum]|uniref:Alpha-1,4 glucan phosphorylase n=2 Tax=Acetanaerobacterium elongatum TaxID=258515 RepID=A0A1H0CIY3_9FIRM|nr:starch phosphorylase [Acetanaerobacterium elongatum]